MKAQLVDLTFTSDGRQRLTLDFYKGHKNDFRAKFDELKEKDVRLTIRRYRKKRSLDANAYFWVIVDKIAEKIGVPEKEIYREAIREIGGVSDLYCMKSEAVEKFRRSWEKNGKGWQTEILPSQLEGCTNVLVYFGSSTYDTEQMSRLIDNIVQDAHALGIETKTPTELARLKSQWVPATQGVK